jgi:hypothetical protein
MIDKELKRLAIDIVEGKVYGTFCMNEYDIELLTAIFMPIFFMDEEQRNELCKDLAHIYEYIDHAGPRSINGHPMFTSMRTLNKQQWAKVCEYIKEYLKIKGAFCSVKVDMTFGGTPEYMKK